MLGEERRQIPSGGGSPESLSLGSVQSKTKPERASPIRAASIRSRRRCCSCHDPASFLDSGSSRDYLLNAATGAADDGVVVPAKAKAARRFIQREGTSSLPVQRGQRFGSWTRLVQ